MRSIFLLLIIGSIFYSCSTTKRTVKREKYLQYLNENIVAVNDSVFTYEFKHPMSDTIILESTKRLDEFAEFKRNVECAKLKELDIYAEDLMRVMKVIPKIRKHTGDVYQLEFEMNMGDDCAGEYDFIYDNCIKVCYITDQSGKVYHHYFGIGGLDVELNSYVKEYSIMFDDLEPGSVSFEYVEGTTMKLRRKYLRFPCKD